MMGFEAGRNAKTGESNTSLTFAGLGIVFIGLFISMYLGRKKKA